jgi:hypothetical protein
MTLIPMAYACPVNPKKVPALTNVAAKVIAVVIALTSPDPIANDLKSFVFFIPTQESHATTKR